MKLNVFILDFTVAGRKLAVPGKRVIGGGISKSQTLPRSMGRSTPTLACQRTTPIKPTSTPPSVKRQLSIPNNGSPVRRPLTPNLTGGKTSAPLRKTPNLKGIDPKLSQLILDEILEGGTAVQWDDIAGQEVSVLPQHKYNLILC